VIAIADSDEVTVIYEGENFEKLGLNNQDYKYRIGSATGNFYWFDIDTTSTPHTAAKSYTGSSVKSGSIGYTNKGEAEVIVYTISTPAPIVPRITGVKVLINGVAQTEGVIAIADSDEVTVIYEGENFEKLGLNNQDYKYRIGPATGNFYWFDINTTSTPHTASKTYAGSNVKSGSIGYTNKGEAEVIVYTISTPAPVVPRITGVTVLINGVEQPEGVIAIADSDEVTVIYEGENFEKLGLNNQDYKYRIGPATGNFYWFTINTTSTPHTASKTYTGSNVKSGSIGYTNKGEAEVIVYTISTPAPVVPRITGVTVLINGVEQPKGVIAIADSDEVTVIYEGENFEKLGLNNQDYKYRIGPATGNFYWFTIDTTSTPHTAAKTYTGSAINYQETIGYTNKGESETVTGYIIKEAYKITYVLDGGTINGEYAQTYVFGDSVSLPQNVTREGYDFDGWYDAAEGGTGPITGFGRPETGDKTFYARWTPKTYTVKFVDWDDKELKSDTVKHGQAAAAPAEPTREGYTFTGWDQAFDQVTGPLTVKAGYRINRYNVIYKVDGVQVGNTETYDFGNTVTIRDKHTKEGYTVSDWSITADFSMPANDVEITATSTVNTHDIVYLVDGEEYERIQNVPYGTAITPIEAPSRTGHTFSGWSAVPATMPDGEVVINGSFTAKLYLIDWIVKGHNEDGTDAGYRQTSESYGNPITEPAMTWDKEGYLFSGWQNVPETMPAEYLVIYGEWIKNFGTITWMVDGKPYAITTATYGKPIALPGTDPEMTGYTFNGWKDIPETMPQTDLIIEAELTANTYQVHWYANGGYIFFPGNTSTLTNQPFGQVIVPPQYNILRTGYTFTGWNTMADGSGDTLDANTIMDQASNTAVFYYAQWTINRYTITFDTDGGTEIAPITQDYGTDVTAPAAPTKTGCIFKGWEPAIPAVMPAENVTVKAQYEEKQTIVIDLTEQVCTYDGTPKPFAIKGDVTDGFTVIYAGGTVPVNGGGRYQVLITRPEDDTYKAFSGISILTINPKLLTDSDITFTIAERSYVYDGEDKMPAVTVKHGDTVLTQGTGGDTLGDFYTTGVNGAAKVGVNRTIVNGRNNYAGGVMLVWEILPTFEASAPAKPGEDGKIVLTAPLDSIASLEYAANEDFTGAQDFDASGTQAAAPGTYYVRIKGLPDEEKPDGSITLGYPASSAVKVVVPAAYSITFDTDGGSAVEPIYGTAGSTITAPSAPTRTGYDFGGWYADAELTAAYVFGTMSAENITVYAKWSPAQGTAYTVKHYHENTSGDGYTLYESEILRGKTNGSTAAESKNYPGFAARAFAQTAILPDGSAVVEIFYDRCTYTVTLITNQGTILADNVTGYTYGIGAKLPAAVTRMGFSFAGWYDNQACKGTPVINITASDLGDKTFYAKWVYAYLPILPTTPTIPTTPVNPPVVNGGENGTVVISPVNPKTGEFVTIIPDPDSGYEIGEIVVTNRNGEPVKVIDNGDGTYSYKQVSGKMTITVTFAEIDVDCSGGKTCPMYGYTDLDMTAWYHDGVHYAIETGLMTGTSASTFAPGMTTTRAMIVTILWRLEGEPVVNYLMGFDDIPSGQWYTEAVRWAAAENIVEGYSDAAFGPNDAITREQLAVIMWRYARYKGIDVSVGENTNILSYDDVSAVAEWAIPAMQWACGSGLIRGIADGDAMNLDPKGSATRAQAATILYRFCEVIIKDEKN